MSNGTFLIVLTAGAALLAMWVHARFPALAPERFGRALVHVVTAFVLLQASSGLAASLTAFVTVVVFVLPALVYALLCTIWVLRYAQAALGISR
jgi:hypothetical protein